MPNRFDRRLKGTGIKPGEGSCSTTRSNLTLTSKSVISTNNTTTSTRVVTTNNIDYGTILKNHKNSINKLNSDINETNIKNETNINFIYKKIEKIEEFLENITVDVSSNMNEDKEELRNDNQLHMKINELSSKFDNIIKNQEILKKMCIDNTNYIKKYKFRKDKVIQEQKEKMNSIIPDIKEYDQTYNLRGVPERLLSGLHSVKSMKDIMPELVTKKTKKDPKKSQKKQQIKKLEEEERRIEEELENKLDELKEIQVMKTQNKTV
tara:strand:- start:2140 stop:2934 length:795 start_codon:yes stop_codon:yes gene_type:complete